MTMQLQAIDPRPAVQQPAQLLVEFARASLADFDMHRVALCTRLPEALPAAPIVVLIADARAVAPLETDLQRLRQARKTALVVLWEPGAIWLAPAMQPDRAGCYLCFKTWAHNNLREVLHWSADNGQQALRLAVAPKPMPAATLDVLALLLRRRLADVLDQQPAASQAIRLQIRDLAISRHATIADSGCRLCDVRPDDSAEMAQLTLAPRLKQRPSDYRAVNSQLSIKQLRHRYVDRWTGLIKHVFHSINSDLMPLYAAETPILEDPNVEVGYGRTETRERSEMVAMLEALERYAGQSARGVKNLVRGSYRELRAHAVNPRQFILHRPEQYSLPGFHMQPYSDDLDYHWKWAYAFAAQKPVLVPEQLAYYWLKRHTPELPINRFVYDSSNGCALGGSVEEAALYGLLEVIERDAYFTTWYARITPKEIDLTCLTDARSRALIARSRAQGYELHVFDIRLEIDIPVVWAMIVDPRADAPVKSYCAAGAHFDPEQAIFGALVEVTTSMGVYSRSLPAFRDKARELFADHQKVIEMNDHVLLYSLPETYPWLSFLFAEDGRRYTLNELYAGADQASASLDLTEDLRRCIDKVLAVADDVILVDQTFPQLRESGLSCVKVLAPGLSPVTFGHQYQRPSLARINRALQHLGLDGDLTLETLNPVPHNFP
jgi:ribosomal protein S12 methylthiotransferase accessory factor